MEYSLKTKLASWAPVPDSGEAGRTLACRHTHRLSFALWTVRFGATNQLLNRRLVH